jgi:hypothetical protein
LDTPQHIAHGFVGAHAIGLPLEACIAVGVAGATPDVVGWIGGRFNSGWTWYNVAHEAETCAYLAIAALGSMLAFQSFLPVLLWGAYSLHVAIDFPLHIDGWRWWVDSKGIAIECLGWVAVLAYFFGGGV